MNQPDFRQPDQFDKVEAGLLKGEVIHAVYDGIAVGSGFIALIGRRTRGGSDPNRNPSPASAGNL